MCHSLIHHEPTQKHRADVTLAAFCGMCHCFSECASDALIWYILSIRRRELECIYRNIGRHCWKYPITLQEDFKSAVSFRPKVLFHAVGTEDQSAFFYLWQKQGATAASCPQKPQKRAMKKWDYSVDSVLAAALTGLVGIFFAFKEKQRIWRLFLCGKDVLPLLPTDFGKRAVKLHSALR